MASVFKPAGKSKYVIFYTDENGRRCKKTGATDKVVTERIARDIENKVALRREGVVDPKAEVYRDHEVKPLADHIAEWQADLIAKGYTAKHADQSADRVRRLLSVMFGANPDEIDGKRMDLTQQKEARRTIAQLGWQSSVIQPRGRECPGRTGDDPGVRAVGPDVQPLPSLHPRSGQMGLEDGPIAGESSDRTHRLQRQ